MTEIPNPMFWSLEFRILKLFGICDLVIGIYSMKLLKIVKNNYLIIIILAAAFLLRIWGLNYGLPHFFVGDEQSIVYGTFKMVELKTLIPALRPDAFRPMYYPPLLAYIYLGVLAPTLGLKYLVGGFAGLADFKNYLILNPSLVWLTIRLVSVVFGTATALLVYLAGKKLFNKTIGLLSAVFLTLSFLHLQLSHFARHWVPATFFVALIIFLSACIFVEPKKKYYLWLGIAAGLGFGISYITCVSLVVFVLAHFMAGEHEMRRAVVSWQKLKDKNFWLAIFIFLGLAIIFILLHPQEFTRILFGEDSGAGGGKSLSGLAAEFLYHFRNLLNFEPLLLASAILGSVILFFKSKKILLLLLSLPVVYILALYLFFHSEVRYIVLVLPVLAVLAGYAVGVIFQKINRLIIILPVMVVIFGYPLALGVHYDFLLTRKDTRELALEWIKENINSKDKVATKFEDIRLTPTKQAILDQRNLAHNSLRIEDYTLLKVPVDQYPAPAFAVLPLHFIGEQLPDNIYQYLISENYKYFMVEFWQPDNLAEQDQKIIREAEPIKEFQIKVNGNFLQDINGNFYQPTFWLFKVDRLGPAIKIYEL